MQPPIAQQLTAYPLIAPTQVAPTPVPTQIAVAETRNGAERMIVLQVVTPAGVATYFLDPESSTAVGKRMIELGGAGIALVPASGLPFPPPR